MFKQPGQGTVSRRTRKLFEPESKFLNQNLLNIRTEFLAHKLVEIASITDISFYYFQNYWNFHLECKPNKHITAFRARKVTRNLEKQAPDLVFYEWGKLTMDHRHPTQGGVERLLVTSYYIKAEFSSRPDEPLGSNDDFNFFP